MMKRDALIGVVVALLAVAWLAQRVGDDETGVRQSAVLRCSMLRRKSSIG